MRLPMPPSSIGIWKRSLTSGYYRSVLRRNHSSFLIWKWRRRSTGNVTFFSILFLTIFDAIGIEKRRQHLYGIILHAIRGIVTATDNILDDEVKGSVILQLQGGRVLPNILVLSMESGVLQEAIYELSGSEKAAKETWKNITHALFALGAEESGEEGDAIPFSIQSSCSTIFIASAEVSYFF